MKKNIVLSLAALAGLGMLSVPVYAVDLQGKYALSGSLGYKVLAMQEYNKMLGEINEQFPMVKNFDKIHAGMELNGGVQYYVLPEVNVGLSLGVVSLDRDAKTDWTPAYISGSWAQTSETVSMKMTMVSATLSAGYSYPINEILRIPLGIGISYNALEYTTESTIEARYLSQSAKATNVSSGTLGNTGFDVNGGIECFPIPSLSLRLIVGYQYNNFPEVTKSGAGADFSGGYAKGGLVWYI